MWWGWCGGVVSVVGVVWWCGECGGGGLVSVVGVVW